MSITRRLRLEGRGHSERTCAGQLRPRELGNVLSLVVSRTIDRFVTARGETEKCVEVSAAVRDDNFIRIPEAFR
jgi:hypothetical protein